MPINNNKQQQTTNHFKFDPLHFILIVLHKKYLFFIPSIAITIITVCISIYIYSSSPVYKYSSILFTLTFNGVTDSKYPNGTKFNEEDIIAAPVLQKVYKDYDLENIYTSFSKFKSSISIKRYNPKLSFLNYEFKAKLADKNISSARRYELEKEFFRQTAIIQAKPQFMVTATYSNIQKYNAPEPLIAKAVYAILKEWMDTAKQKQGVTKYDIALLSKPMETLVIENTDYFNGADYLRKMYENLYEELNQLNKIPNIYQITISENGHEYNLKDLSYRLRYIKNYMLTPMFDNFSSTPIYNNKSEVISYLENQLEHIKLQLTSIKEEKINYENMIINHIISSHEPLVSLNNKASELKRDLKFYSDFFKIYKSSNSNISKENIKIIEKKQKKIFLAENKMIQSIYNFYIKASKYNLEKKSSFYKINGFSSYNIKKLKFKYVAIITIALWLIIEVIFALIIILFVFFKEIFKNVNYDNIK
ncbi:MAG TPA: hypothetical protein QF753_06410 [Victivallales bacterium]|nr:hypothetical protein [Victivallales bacterium]